MFNYVTKRRKEIIITDDIYFNIQLNHAAIGTIIASLSQIAPFEISSYGKRHNVPVMGFKEYSKKNIWLLANGLGS